MHSITSKKNLEKPPKTADGKRDLKSNIFCCFFEYFFRSHRASEQFYPQERIIQTVRIMTSPFLKRGLSTTDLKPKKNQDSLVVLLNFEIKIRI